MADLVDFNQARVLVELGPGTGVVTREVVSRMAPCARLLVLEISATFVDHLRETIADARVAIQHDSAENLRHHLADMGLREADVIFCGLPFASMPADVNQRIVASSRSLLAAGGLFVGYCYVPFKLSKLLSGTFGEVKWEFVLRNLPPAFVLSARR